MGAVGATRATRPDGRRALAAVAVVTLWTGFQIAGWTLVYLPHVPDGFSYNPGITPGEYPPIVEAFYFSAVNMSTLGLGDVYPIDPWVRLFAPFQALIGFALLTAAVSWFIELYPGLGRRRALALRIALTRRADTADHLLNMESATSSGLLDSITADSGQMLEEAVDDFAHVLRGRFIPAAVAAEGDTDATLREYARQHRQRPWQAPDVATEAS